MKTKSYEIGMVGLGVMGRNLLLNMADHGHSVAGFDKDATKRMGNLKNQSFKEIWNNGEYRNFRSQILKGRKNIDICANCSEGTKVWG